tara:strand:- start:117339 stop:118124 length:786 start_codon:yes stop_codon:yes gene_type:complete
LHAKEERPIPRSTFIPSLAVLCGGSVMALAFAGFPAAAQSSTLASAEVMTDYRVRGLSWSDGETTAQAYVGLPISSRLDASITATALRESSRHGGSDVGVDLAAYYGDRAGLFDWYGGVVGHLFAGAEGSMDYAEVRAGGSVTLGPAAVDVSASYAPSQDAIGGSNLYGRIGAQAGIWGSPITFRGHVGRSTGSVDDPVRANRLRPGGDYTDWLLGADYVLGPFLFGLAYTDTDIDASEAVPAGLGRDAGSRIVARARFDF